MPGSPGTEHPHRPTYDERGVEAEPTSSFAYRAAIDDLDERRARAGFPGGAAAEAHQREKYRLGRLMREARSGERHEPRRRDRIRDQVVAAVAAEHPAATDLRVERWVGHEVDAVVGLVSWEKFGLPSSRLVPMRLLYIDWIESRLLDHHPGLREAPLESPLLTPGDVLSLAQIGRALAKVVGRRLAGKLGARAAQRGAGRELASSVRERLAGVSARGNGSTERAVAARVGAEAGTERAAARAAGAATARAGAGVAARAGRATAGRDVASLSRRLNDLAPGVAKTFRDRAATYVARRPSLATDDATLKALAGIFHDTGRDAARVVQRRAKAGELAVLDRLARDAGVELVKVVPSRKGTKSADLVVHLAGRRRPVEVEIRTITLGAAGARDLPRGIGSAAARRGAARTLRPEAATTSEAIEAAFVHKLSYGQLRDEGVIVVHLVKAPGGGTPSVSRRALDRINAEAATHAEALELWISTPTARGRELLRLDMKPGDLQLADRL